MKRIMFVLLALVFSAAMVCAAADKAGDKGGKGKSDEKKAQAGEHGKGKPDGVGQKDGKGKGDRKALAKGKQDRLKGLERAVARLKEIAQKLEDKGKKEQATRLRDKIAKIEKKIAEKKVKVMRETADAEKAPEEAPK